MRQKRTNIAIETDSDLSLEGGRNVAAKCDRTTSEPDQAA